MDNEAANMCLQLEGVDRRDVVGQSFYMRTGAVARIIACNPRASQYKWTVEADGKKMKCQTSSIDWATGPIPV